MSRRAAIILLAFNPNVALRGTAIEYISRWNPNHERNIADIFDELEIEKFRNLKDVDNIKEMRNSLLASVSRAEELSAYFKVPNQQMLSNVTPPPISSPNQLVPTFINFLLLMVEAIIYRESACNSMEEFSVENLVKELEFPTQNLPSEVKFLIQNLQAELGFLLTFLGDTAMHWQPIPTTTIMTDIEDVVNQVGSFIFSYFLTFSLHSVVAPEEVDNYLFNNVNIEGMHNGVRIFLLSILNEPFEDIQLQTSEVEEIDNTTTQIKEQVHKVQNFVDFFVPPENDDQVQQQPRILGLALSNLLQKFEHLNTKIKEHCIKVPKLPSNHMAPNTAVVSLFIVDSVLDDLMYLINNKSCRTDGVDDQIEKLHEELMLLGSSINEIAESTQAQHESLTMRTIDVAYEVEHVINRLPPVWYLTFRLPQLICKIRLITVDIEKIKNQTNAPREKQVANYHEEQVSSPSKQTPVLEANIVGFQQVEREIIEQLVGGTTHRQIISICGMPGLGKTTLANKLYNHPSVVKYFDCRAWCVSSTKCNKRSMLIDVLVSLGRLKREDIEEDEDLGEKVYKFVSRRRYLLVIDDIWDINAWDDFKRYFPDDGTGSRILFTTRNKEVGSEASASFIKELSFLSDAQCWELLQRKVFQGEKCPQELLDTGKNIATKCQGLPLAVVVIAGVLASTEKKEHSWKKVESSISSQIAKSPDNCIQLLELSYKHLPVNLKPCFLYFGVFEEDTEISVQMLTSIWIAERFIKKEEGKSLEDVALEYLTKLIDRSLVLVSKRRSNGQVKACRIHDLLLDMCLRIADEHCFFKKVKFFKALKILHFDKGSYKYVLSGIEHMVQLRYLAITSGIEALPIPKYHRLEFLEVNNSAEVGITLDLLNMVNLRRMHFEGGTYFSESCRLQATSDESFHINNKVLQSISVVNILDKTDEKILRCFPNLRKLEAKLYGSFNFSFSFLGQLESLKLDIRSSSCFISLPSNLKHFTLVAVEDISQEKMEMIERLEYLEVLKLDKVGLEGERWDISEFAFPQLKVLKLIWVGISYWNASNDTFSCLQRLVLQQCNSLEVIPSFFGDIPTLQKIELIGCSNSINESAKEIENYQKQMGNEELQVILPY